MTEVVDVRALNRESFQELSRSCVSEAASKSRKRLVRVHTGTCGIASGSGMVKAYLERHLKESEAESDLLEVGCCGSCYAEPMITVVDPDGTEIRYHDLDEEKLGTILERHLVKGKVVEELRMDPESPFWAKQEKRVTKLLGAVDPYEIGDYLANDGYQGLYKVLSLNREEVLEEVRKSGLKGRGGAGFPTGVKWGFAAKAPGPVKYVICNADEGDPGAYMDRAIIEGNPHLMLEGLAIAAYAIGASEGFVYIRAEYPLAVKILRNAINQARELGLLGNDIMGSGFDFDVEIVLGAGAFVCGEETALISSIEGKRGNPRPKPPFPANKGLYDKPTIINNVKTLSNVPLIFVKGADWFSSVGTEKSKGTMIFSLTGKIKRAGLIEVPLGIPLGEIIFDIGGGIPDGKGFKAVQLGGPSGGCIPGQYLNTPVDYADIESLGAIMGSGGMIVMDEDSCMPDMARFFMDFTKEESCGKCTPCRAGIPQMLEILDSIVEGRALPEDLKRLESLALMIKECSLCGLGQTAPNPVLSTLRHFKDEYLAHIIDQKCPAATCQGLFRSPCEHACPLGTDIPGALWLIKEGRYVDAYRLISQFNPLPSVCGRVCVHFCESKCRRAQIDERLSINHLLRFAADHAHGAGVEWVPETGDRGGKKVAVIGSGPAGLSAAFDLARYGYEVTVFEATTKIGGMLVWGIPEYRLPREVFESDVEVLRKMGVRILVDSKITDVEALISGEYDAVFVATGLPNGLRMGIPGEDLEGVYEGVDFLYRINSGEEIDVGQSVAVVGGGNVAIDVARVCKRMGADDVRILYRRERCDMPAIEDEIEDAEKEGVEVIPLTSVKRIVGAEGRLKHLECAKMALMEFDSSCRRRPKEIPGSDFVTEVDTFIEAIGQRADGWVGDAFETDRRSLIIADERTLETGMPGVFAGGDAVSGPSTVVEAIAAGQRAAFSIDCYLQGKPIAKRMRRGLAESLDLPEEEVEVTEEDRVVWEKASPGERVADFREVVYGYSGRQAKKEACRCLRCDISY
jgi:NADH-quinone oxidoreductase subunit F